MRQKVIADYWLKAWMAAPLKVPASYDEGLEKLIRVVEVLEFRLPVTEEEDRIRHYFRKNGHASFSVNGVGIKLSATGEFVTIGSVL